MDDDTESGSIDYLVVEFPGDKMRGAGLALLVDLVDGGVGRVLDLVFIRKANDDSVRVIDVSALAADVELDLEVLDGVPSGHLDQLDIAAAGEHIDAGSSAGIIVFESHAPSRTRSPESLLRRDQPGEHAPSGRELRTTASTDGKVASGPRRRSVALHPRTPKLS
jgi:hypothetical protein